MHSSHLQEGHLGGGAVDVRIKEDNAMQCGNVIVNDLLQGDLLRV